MNECRKEGPRWGTGRKGKRKREKGKILRERGSREVRGVSEERKGHKLIENLAD